MKEGKRGEEIRTTFRCECQEGRTLEGMEERRERERREKGRKGRTGGKGDEGGKKGRAKPSQKGKAPTRRAASGDASSRKGGPQRPFIGQKTLRCRYARSER